MPVLGLNLVSVHIPRQADLPPKFPFLSLSTVTINFGAFLLKFSFTRDRQASPGNGHLKALRGHTGNFDRT